jgi:hypothetical protein
MIPKFDPSKPFEEYKPKTEVPVFDPSQPFEDVNDSSYVPSINTALETGQDFLTGASQGATLGGADELGGMAAAGIETFLGKLGIGPAAVDEQLAAQGFTGDVGESFLQKYRGYQEAGEKAALEARERSPVAEFGGQLGGALLSTGALGLNKAAIQGPKALFGQIAKNKGTGEAALALLRGTATSGSRFGDAVARGVGMYGAAAPAIAAESALSSQADIIGEKADLGQVASDVGLGVGLGLPVMMGLNVAPELPGIARDSVTKRLEPFKEKIAQSFADENNPKLRQIAMAYQKYGKELGVSPRSAGQEIKRGAEITPMQAREILDGRLGLGPKVDPASIQVQGDDVAYSLKDSIAADKLQSGLDYVDNFLGKKTGEAIEKSTVQIDVDPIIQQAANEIEQIVTQYPRLAKNRKSAKAYESILTGGTQLSARQVKDLVDDLDYNIGVFKRSTDLDVGEREILPELLSLRAQLSSTLKKNVPEYRAQAEQFESWREVIEQLIAGPNDPVKSEIFFGKLPKGDKKVHEAILKLIEDAAGTAASSAKDRTAFTKFMNKLAEFQALDAERATRGLQRVAPDSEQIRKFILQASDDANLRQSVRRTAESRSVKPNWAELVIGKAPESAAYLAGWTAKSVGDIGKKPVVQKTAAITKAIYNAPAQSVANLASKLEASGNFSQVGKALRESLENGDTAKKNAALFTIMQNPNARAFISAEDFPDSENVEE